ncbi:MAG: DUF4214 domain-containing protein [Lachnospiraceae bacterium]|nr:DUF4214 domain-containing protein [Lachnospiraceae bacterium]
MKRKMVTKLLALMVFAFVGAGAMSPMMVHAEGLEEAPIRAEYDAIASDGSTVHVIDQTTEGGPQVISDQGHGMTYEEAEALDRLLHPENYPEVNQEQGATIEDPEGLVRFVSRMYSVVLGRKADQEGLNDWVTKLASGQAQAVDIVQGFMCSEEYVNKCKSNVEIVNDCYHAMLDRDADVDGYNDWVSKLDTGMSVNAILAGFVGSQEFGNLCQTYGIEPGSYTSGEARDQNAGVTSYVARLYTQALGRNYDAEGLNSWCGVIVADTSRDNIIQVAADGFFHSQEFVNKNLDDTEYVKVLYRTFLGRECDEEGLGHWIGQLDAGASRDDILPGFANSQEFSDIMAQYGL